MPKADRNSQRENKSRGNEPNFNWRGIILLAIGFGCIALAMLYFRGGMQPIEDVPYNRFLELLENKQIVNDKNYPLISCRRGWPNDANPARRLYSPGNGGIIRPARSVSNHGLFNFHQ